MAVLASDHMLLSVVKVRFRCIWRRSMQHLKYASILCEHCSCNRANYSVALAAALFNDFHPNLQLAYAMLLLSYSLMQQLQSSARSLANAALFVSMKCFKEAFIEQQLAEAANTL
jgi:hypothetical protein